METSIHPTQMEEPFPNPSGVNVADTVPLKLCPTSYLAWKQLMLTFLESHNLRGFVDGTINPPNKPSPLGESSVFIENRREEELMPDQEWEHICYQRWKSSDDLVRGWIVATVTEEILLQVTHLANAREVWIKLEKIPPFPFPTGINVADSVTLKLCRTNYFVWKQLMLTFLESHGLSGFVDGTINPPKGPSPLGESSVLEEEEEREWKRRKDWDQRQQRDWENLWQGECVREQKRVEEWDRQHERREGEWEQEQERREKWKREWGEKWKEVQEDQERRQESDRERERREDLKRERREEERIYTGWKRSDTLVRGWILTTVTEEKLPQVMHLETAQEVWIKLWKKLATPFQLSHLQLIDSTDQKRGQILSKYEVLHKAALTADWDTAANFLDQKPDAVCQPITWCLETALIVAVRSAKRNHFVKELVERMAQKSVALLAQKNISGATALHAAVEGGNIVAAELLVQKNSKLANIEDKYGTLPVHMAAGLGNREMVDYLLEHTNLSENESGLKLLHSLASGELYDIALTFLQQHRNLASMEPSPLVVLAQSPTSFLSGTSFNWFERFIYSVIPLKSEVIANHTQVSDIENADERVVSSPISGPQKRGIENTVERVVSSPISGSQESDIENIVERVVSSLISVRQKLKALWDAEFCYAVRQKLNALWDAEIPVRQKLKALWDAEFCYAVRQKLNALWDAEIPVSQKLNALFWDAQELVSQKLNALFWDVAEKLDSIKSLRETKLIHHQALNLVKCLCEEVNVVKTDFLNGAKIFREPLLNATCVGIHEIVEEILESFPSAFHLRNEKDQSLFHLAILYRQENIFNLINQMDEDPRVFLSMPDASENNALHLAGNLAPLLRTSDPVAALQMQHELQWFKKVGNFILPQAKEHLNADRKTPQEVFTDTHKDLVKQGENWMKDTANSCAVVAALITTIVFAAAITVPGGSNSDSGHPIRLGDLAFTLFEIFNTLAFFCSSASLLTFLSIHMSRYGEQDFLLSLPMKMVLMHGTVFLSIIYMIVAFGVTIKIVFGEKAWIVIPVVLYCGSFGLVWLLQFHVQVLIDMFKSTYNLSFRKLRNRFLHQREENNEASWGVRLRKLWNRILHQREENNEASWGVRQRL